MADQDTTRQYRRHRTPPPEGLDAFQLYLVKRIDILDDQIGEVRETQAVQTEQIKSDREASTQIAHRLEKVEEATKHIGAIKAGLWTVATGMVGLVIAWVGKVIFGVGS